MKMKITLFTLFATMLTMLIITIILNNTEPEKASSVSSISATQKDNNISYDIQSTRSTSINPTAQSPLDINLEHFTLNHELLSYSFITPAYINEQIIASSLSEPNEYASSHIVVVDRASQTLKTIYTAPLKQSINSLVGIADHLYWVENYYLPQDDTPWVIKALSLATGEVSDIKSGLSTNQLSPPILSTALGLVTWDENNAHNHIITSTAITYNPLNQLFDSVAVAEYDEERTTGIIFYLQHPTDEGILVEQEQLPVDSHSERTFQVVLYPYDKSPPIIMVDNINPLDFTANSQFFIWTDTDSLFVINRVTNELIYEINDPTRAPNEGLGFDSPIIRDGLVYYRYSTANICALDLHTGIVHDVVNANATYSKIYNSEGVLSFSYMPAIEVKNEVEFFIIRVK